MNSKVQNNNEIYKFLVYNRQNVKNLKKSHFPLNFPSFMSCSTFSIGQNQIYMMF